MQVVANNPHAMTETSRSLLERLRQDPDENSWKRLVDLYTPLLQRWLRQFRAQGPDADDLLQEVFATLVCELPAFQHNQQRGAFRCWLRTILLNRLRAFWKTRRTAVQVVDSEQLGPLLEHLEDPASELSRLWDREHDVFVARRLLDLIEGDFTPPTWRAFRRLVLDGARPAEVAAELGLSVNAVLIARWRVLRRARQEIDGLID
jgi:RNA polymerase sigma-70 factor, ECF subfamily